MTDSEAEQKISALNARIDQLVRALNEQAGSIEKLAKVSGLVYLQDLKEWVSEEKLNALRKEPR